MTLAPLYAQVAEFPARHDHQIGGCAGFLRFDANGVSFAQAGDKKRKHDFALAYADIQELAVGTKKVHLVSYHDRAWLLGKDQPYDFTLDDSPNMLPLYSFLSSKLDQRFVAMLADASGGVPQWSIPVKRLEAMRGQQGKLTVLADKLVFETSQPDSSRTWRDKDIENISSAGPFQMTVVTFEPGGTFNFELKEPLDPDRYQTLWLRLNRPKGLSLAQSPRAPAE